MQTNATRTASPVRTARKRRSLPVVEPLEDRSLLTTTYFAVFFGWRWARRGAQPAGTRAPLTPRERFTPAAGPGAGLIRPQRAAAREVG